MGGKLKVVGEGLFLCGTCTALDTGRAPLLVEEDRRVNGRMGASFGG
jgi:hypothetical protein